MPFPGRRIDEKELDAEIQGYFDLIVDRYVAQGLTVEQARLKARRRLEGAEQIKEKVRDARSGAMIESVIRQIRYSIRGMLRSPGFTTIALLTLALGIGASTAVFTVVDTVILKPLAYRDSGQLVALWERIPFLSSDPTGPNPRHADVWNRRSTAFSGIALVRQSARGMASGDEHPQTVGAVVAYTNLFDVLQVKPLMGRLFENRDAIPGRESVAILTYSLWRSAFHADPAVIGRMARLEGVPHRIIGVLPADFRFPNGNALQAFHSAQGVTNVLEPALFVPAAIDLNTYAWGGEYGNWIALGRLKAGATLAQAQAQLMSIGTQIGRDHKLDALQASVQPLQEAVTGQSANALWFVLAAVLCLMLIACVNLANAQLGRALSRSREAAIRSALGASRGQLIFSSMSESIVLAVVGGIGGTLLAAGALYVFREYSPVDIPRLAEAHISPSVLGFALLLTLGSCLLFGTLPALRSMRADPKASVQRGAVPLLLIALQVFGCTVLLLLTGLFSKSLLHLLGNDTGFDARNVTVAQVRLPPKTYATAASRTVFNDEVLARLRRLPGVQSAAMVSAMPLEGESWIEELRRVDRPRQDTPLLNLRWVSTGYFETLRQKLVAGRFFDERDRYLQNAVLSEGEAHAVWPNENPLGARIEIEGREFTVIGIVADSRSTSLKAAPSKIAYVHYHDKPPNSSVFVVRGAQNAESLIDPVRQAIWALAPDMTIARVTTLESQLSHSVAKERFQTNLLIAFGTAALLLAMLGIYGVLSYSVACRKQEIGVRMALGAAKGRIYRLILGEASIPVVLGLMAGLVAGSIAARVVQKMLYDVQAIDPAVIVVIAGLFVGAAVAAAFIPARRAASTDPLDVLRAE